MIPPLFCLLRFASFARIFPSVPSLRFRFLEFHLLLFLALVEFLSKRVSIYSIDPFPSLVFFIPSLPFDKGLCSLVISLAAEAGVTPRRPQSRLNSFMLLVDRPRRHFPEVTTISPNNIPLFQSFQVLCFRHVSSYDFSYTLFLCGFFFFFWSVIRVSSEPAQALCVPVIRCLLLLNCSSLERFDSTFSISA